MDIKPYRYHPIRYHFLRDGYDYGDFWEAAWENDLGESEIAEMGGEQRLGEIIEREESLHLFLDRFEKAGRRIFHLEQELVRMFRRTSVDDVSIDLLLIPYECVFLYFGIEAGVRVPGDGRFIDGAYVMLSGDDKERLLMVLLCPEFPDLAGAKALSQIARLREDEGYRHIYLSSDAGPIGQAHANLFIPIGERISEFEYYRVQKTMRELHPDTPRRSYEEFRAADDIDAEDALWKGHDKEALNLIVNALAFLTSRPDDLDFGFHADAPQALASKADQGPGTKEAKRATSKLEALGYRRVYTCGRHFAAARAAGPQEGPGTHWRRGHWRNQAHGPQNAQRKLIWIEPVLVSPSGEPILGRIHK